MYEDNPEGPVPAGPGGLPGLLPLARHPGPEGHLSKMTGEWLRTLREHYRPDRIVVSLAGSFRSQDVEELGERFSALEPGKSPPPGREPTRRPFTLKKKAIEQEPPDPGLPWPPPTAMTGALPFSSFPPLWEAGMSSPAVAGGAGEAGTVLLGLLLHGGPRRDRPLRHLYRPGPGDGGGRPCAHLRRSAGLCRARDLGGGALPGQEQAKTNILMGLESTQARMSHMGRGAALRPGAHPRGRDHRGAMTQWAGTDRALARGSLTSSRSPCPPWGVWGE